MLYVIYLQTPNVYSYLEQKTDLIGDIARAFLKKDQNNKQPGPK